MLLIAFALLNFRAPGFILIFTGLLLNAIVIVANHGMPVAREALVRSGQESTTLRPAASTADPNTIWPMTTRCCWCWVTRSSCPQPIGVAVSVGDLCVYLGVAWCFVASLQPRERERGQHLRRRRLTFPLASPISEAMAESVQLPDDIQRRLDALQGGRRPRRVRDLRMVRDREERPGARPRVPGHRGPRGRTQGLLPVRQPHHADHGDGYADPVPPRRGHRVRDLEARTSSRGASAGRGQRAPCATAPATSTTRRAAI